jgi:sec-independent protein translocase protein TatC
MALTGFMRKKAKPPDADDMFSDTRMSFGEHIEDLRYHLWRAIVGFLICLVFSFFIGQPLLRFIVRPVEAELDYFHAKRAQKIKQELDEGRNASLNEMNDPREIDVELQNADGTFSPTKLRIRPLGFALQTQQAQRIFLNPNLAKTLGPTEAFMVYLKVCMVSGLVIGSPWIFWQLWSFVAVGLYPHEKKYVNYYLPFSVVLFLAGVLVCEFIVIPQAIHVLLEFNEWIGLEPDLRLNEWLSFAILMPLVFGLAFQTPMVMLVLAKIGIFTSASFRAKRKIAWFIMAFITAVIVPSTDLLSMLLMWGPMCALYELGIVLARYGERSGDQDLDVPEPGEMVEV